MLIQRPQYMKFLTDWQNQPIIKVVSGLRRCGKSTLFQLFRQQLVEQGVAEEQMISINFEDMDFEELTDYRTLHKYLKARLLPGRTTYIFLDEVQHVPHFEKVVDSLFVQPDTDIYLTGSNAWFMSGELATLLSGRYVELKMLPLSFAEYASAFPEITDKQTLYRNYLLNSSFPYTVRLNDRQNVLQYLDGIFNTVVLNDIVERKRLQDPAMLKSVLRFLFDNIGSLTTPKKISDSLTSAGRKVSNHTVETYLEGITDSLLMYRATRYDVKGREHLKLQEKYYLADLGLRYYLLGTRAADGGHILENVVYLELLRRGYQVFVGKVGTAEVDFVAVSPEGRTEYYQVSQTVREETTLRRELAPLDAIPDHYPKFLLTLDNDPPADYNGIRQVYALDWLLGKETQMR